MRPGGGRVERGAQPPGLALQAGESSGDEMEGGLDPAYARKLARAMTREISLAHQECEASSSNRRASMATRKSFDTWVKGHIRIKVLEASDLRAVDTSNIFRAPSSNPYASIYLRHLTGKQSHRRRTNQQKRNLFPKWKAPFEFSLKESPSEIALHVDVFHQCSREGVGGRFLGLGKGDQFLGHAELPLCQVFTKKEPFRIMQPISELGLQVSSDYPEVTDVTGTVKLEIAWVPSLGGGGHLRSTGKLWMDALSSPQAIRVVHVAMIGLSGLICFVAANCRWLCRGAAFRHCEEIEVPGASTCTTVAGLAALAVFLIHFLGSAGLFGSLWARRPLSLYDLLDKDAEVEVHDGEDDLEECPDEEKGPSLKLQVQWGGPGSGSADVSFVPFCCGSGISGAFITWIRVFSMLLNLVALGFCGLALTLVHLRVDSDTFGAEAFLLDIGALAALASAFFFSLRERRLMANLEPSWVAHDEAELSQPYRKTSSQPIWADTDYMQTILQNSIQSTVDKWNLTAQQVETLTQPLLRQANELPEGLQEMLQNLGAGSKRDHHEPQGSSSARVSKRKSILRRSNVSLNLADNTPKQGGAHSSGQRSPQQAMEEPSLEGELPRGGKSPFLCFACH